MIFIRIFFRFFDLAWEEATPLQISLGIMMGLLLAFSPLVSLQGLFFIATVALIKINLIATLAGYLLFTPCYFVLENKFHALGDRVLTCYPSLHGLLAWMYHAPVVPFTWFNSTVVLGAAIFASVASPVLFAITYFLVIRFRTPISRRFFDSGTWRYWLNSDLRRIYDYDRSQ